MKLSSIDITNFRLLRKASVRFGAASSSTILVGPNNSGKTSLAEVLQLFTAGSGQAFSASDFSLDCRASFEAAQVAFLAEPAGADAEKSEPPRMPLMSITLHFEYADVAEDLATASDLLMDIDKASWSVAVTIEYMVSDAEALGTAFKNERADNESLYDFLASRLNKYYGLAYFKVAPATNERERLPDGTVLDRLIRINVVGAQRHIDDQENSQATLLSRLLHKHYTQRYKTDDPEGHKELELILKKQSSELSGRYMKAFEGLIAALMQFGYPQKQSPRLSVRAELDAKTLFKDNTRVFYTAEMPKPDGAAVAPTHDLPEKYNGLGFKNLIYMILQVKAFREEFDGTDGVRPRVHLIIIEEPEVHLHPQMQSVFIRQISKFLKSDDAQNEAQLLLTTHSSHIVADCGFSPVRYFRRKGNEAVVKDLLDFHSKSATSEQKEAIKFLGQYLTQTRCDLLFSDKAILVEGPVERLLLPCMVAQAATGAHENLASDYISVLEVGGAYAHLFKSLLEFIELPTLIITDLDSIGADRKKCKVADGLSSSNATLTKWLPGKGTLADLRASTAAQKTSGQIRVAYQVPEADAQPCGRSFEEAFLYRNADWIMANAEKLVGSAEALTAASADELRARAYQVSINEIEKVDFALDLMLADGWQTPRYIADGLAWLAEQNA